MTPPKYFLYARKSTVEDDGSTTLATGLDEGSIESQLIGTPPNHLRQGFGGPPSLLPRSSHFRLRRPEALAKAEGFGRRAELREFARKERLTIALCFGVKSLRVYQADGPALEGVGCASSIVMFFHTYPEILGVPDVEAPV